MTDVRDRRIFVFIIATLALARGVGGRMPYFLLYVALGVALVAYFWTTRGLNNISCSYAVARRRLVSGEPLDIRLRLYNEWLLPLPWVEISDDSPLGTAISSVVSLPAVGSRILNYSVPGVRRGLYRLGPLRLRTGDLFGLFEAEREVYSDVTVLVLPRLVPLTHLDIPPRQPFGSRRTRERAFEDPSNLSEVRPFRPGDHRKMVHWRTTARKGELYAKEFELTATTELRVLLDLESTAYAGPTAELSEDTAVEAAAAVCYYAASARHDVDFTGYAAGRLHLRLGRGVRRFGELMEILAQATASGDIPLVEALTREARYASPRSTIVTISPGMSDELAAAIFRLRMSGFGTTCVVVSDSDTIESWQAAFRSAHIPLYWIPPGGTIARATGGGLIASR